MGQRLRERLQKVDRQWAALEADFDSHISVVSQEFRRNFQALVHEQETLAKRLQEAIIASGEATDAEELSEHVDVSSASART